MSPGLTDFDESTKIEIYQDIIIANINSIDECEGTKRKVDKLS